MINEIDTQITSQDINEIQDLIHSKLDQSEENIQQIITETTLEIYWDCGQNLIELDEMSHEELSNFSNIINNELQNDSLLKSITVNNHSLLLSKIWVAEHSQHDKQIIRSGIISWERWSILLEAVNSAPHRYWLACQAIKHGWDDSTLLQAVKSLPEQYLRTPDTEK